LKALSGKDSALIQQALGRESRFLPLLLLESLRKDIFNNKIRLKIQSRQELLIIM